MANKTIDALVYCPFYLREAALTITCEGIIGDTTVSKFATQKKKEEHEYSFCTGCQCVGCGVYSALMQNYFPSPARGTAALRH